LIVYLKSGLVDKLDRIDFFNNKILVFTEDKKMRINHYNEEEVFKITYKDKEIYPFKK